SLIMPCRNEAEDVMRATLERLLSQRHREVEILISVGHDDLDTTAIARRLAEEHPDRVRVCVDYSPVKNKPRQLNSALKMCRND
ncbi:glycosyltransferase, partial [Acinetobacter baumannii]|uniref:glycosyltransferase n=1 Tax=Acinetobacter baumannii TaxID=470 RepID=UPI003D6AF8AE